MKLLAHRGIWETTKEKNTFFAFKKSIDYDHGFEIDLRSFNGRLFVSHDPLLHQDVDLNNPEQENVLLFNNVLKYYSENKSEVVIAINVKEDGLAPLINNCLKEYSINNYFVFDMSIPDTIAYSKLGMIFYARQSEYETVVNLYDKAEGIWLDEFEHHWISDDVLNLQIERGKQLCIVSPELHGRNYVAEWEHYKNFEASLVNETELILCTDNVIEADGYFNH